jgi:hypothetical protein
MVPSTRKISTKGGISTKVTRSARRDSKPKLAILLVSARARARKEAMVIDMMKISSPAAGLVRSNHCIIKPLCTRDQTQPAAPQMRNSTSSER